MKRVHDALVLVVQKRYPGASGWTYDQEHGFSVCDDNRDAWKEFIKHHAIFKPFANKGWKFFDDFKEIIPGRARGTNVFNPAVTAVAPSQDFDDASQLSNDASQLSNGASQLSQESTPQPRLPESSNRSQYFPENGFDDFDFPESLLNNSQSQPFTDWSQTQFGSTQPLTQPIDATQTHAAFQPLVPATPTTQTRIPSVPATPAASLQRGRTTAPLTPAASSGGVKRAASDEFETPWTAKRGKTTGADALLAIGGSVDRVGNAIRDCFMPQKSSAISPRSLPPNKSSTHASWQLMTKRPVSSHRGSARCSTSFSRRTTRRLMRMWRRKRWRAVAPWLRYSSSTFNGFDFGTVCNVLV